METILQFKNKEYQLLRYPITNDRSLKAWSSVEVLVLDYLENKDFKNYHLFNDRFGVWNCVLNDRKTKTIWTYASQKKAIEKNLTLNELSFESSSFLHPLEDFGKVDCALIKMPKSIELFELFLANIHKNSTEITEVVCGFMTKYFSASYLKIAEYYFEEVIQSKAWKKARLLILKKPKKNLEPYKELINKISWKNRWIKQYYGVFSAKGIDIGTQFLLENLTINSKEKTVLDLACGNGIIANEALKLNSEAEVTLIDDFNLAISSSKLNLPSDKTNFFCNNTLETLPCNHFDLVLSNPPFHFEYENNIDVSIKLFTEVNKCLKPKGRFVLVANKHLNYRTHLNKLFVEVRLLNSNKKFEILECLKS